MWIVYFWNVPYSSFRPQLTEGNWNHGKRSRGWGSHGAGSEELRSPCANLETGLRAAVWGFTISSLSLYGEEEEEGKCLLIASSWKVLPQHLTHLTLSNFYNLAGMSSVHRWREIEAQVLKPLLQSHQFISGWAGIWSHFRFQNYLVLCLLHGSRKLSACLVWEGNIIWNFPTAQHIQKHLIHMVSAWQVGHHSYKLRF